jgi:hypothetical protein
LLTVLVVLPAAGVLNFAITLLLSESKYFFLDKLRRSSKNAGCALIRPKIREERLRECFVNSPPNGGGDRIRTYYWR